MCLHPLLHSRCTRDDLDEFTCDDSLSGAVVGQSELVNHLACRDSGGDGVGDSRLTRWLLTKELT